MDWAQILTGVGFACVGIMLLWVIFKHDEDSRLKWPFWTALFVGFCAFLIAIVLEVQSGKQSVFNLEPDRELPTVVTDSTGHQEVL